MDIHNYNAVADIHTCNKKKQLIANGIADTVVHLVISLYIQGLSYTKMTYTQNSGQFPE